MIANSISGTKVILVQEKIRIQGRASRESCQRLAMITEIAAPSAQKQGVKVRVARTSDVTTYGGEHQKMARNLSMST